MDNINFTNRCSIERPSWAEYFLNIAVAVSQRSHDAQTKVGAVIVNPQQRIISTGYNGFPVGATDSLLPNLRPDKYYFIIHAEINALSSASQDLRFCSLYLTHSPCAECAKSIVSAGIKNIYFRYFYDNSDYNFVKNFLQSCSVQLVHIDFCS